MRTTKMHIQFSMMTFVKFCILFCLFVCLFVLSIRDNASAWWNHPPAEITLDVRDCSKGQEMTESST